MAICARIFIELLPRPARLDAARRHRRSSQSTLFILRTIDELVAVGAHGAVVVEAVAELRVAADHVGRLDHDAGHRVVDAAARAGDLGARRVDDVFLRVVHHHHARHHALADDRTRGDRAVHVEQLDPVVVLDAGALRVVFAEPDDGSAAGQRLHDQIVGVGAVDAPLLVRRDEVQQRSPCGRWASCRACRRSSSCRPAAGSR